jgi:hypothetical protein
LDHRQEKSRGFKTIPLRRSEASPQNDWLAEVEDNGMKTSLEAIFKDE